MKTLEVWHSENGEAPRWRDRDDYAVHYGVRWLLWLGELCEPVTWPWSPAVLATPLRGRVRAKTRQLDTVIDPQDVLAGEAGGLRFEPAGPDALIAVLWTPERDRLPACRRGDRDFTNALTRFACQAGAAITGACSEPARLELDRVDDVRERELGGLAERCPGRSARHRRQLFLRLLRARNLIDHGLPDQHDLAALAAVANLSPSHFLRLFHSVFGVSPHRYLVRQRMLEARRRVVETLSPIAAIAQQLGFVNRCAFARLFKQHFGTPATRLRRQSLAQARIQLAQAVALVFMPASPRA